MDDLVGHLGHQVALDHVPVGESGGSAQDGDVDRSGGGAEQLEDSLGAVGVAGQTNVEHDSPQVEGPGRPPGCVRRRHRLTGSSVGRRSPVHPQERCHRWGADRVRAGPPDQSGLAGGGGCTSKGSTASSEGCDSSGPDSVRGRGGEEGRGRWASADIGGSGSGGRFPTALAASKAGTGRGRDRSASAKAVEAPAVTVLALLAFCPPRPGATNEGASELGAGRRLLHQGRVAVVGDIEIVEARTGGPPPLQVVAAVGADDQEEDGHEDGDPDHVVLHRQLREAEAGGQDHRGVRINQRHPTQLYW